MAVGFKIIDSTGAVIYEQTSVIDSVASGETVTVTFPAGSSLTIAGVYTIRSYSELSGDQIRGNDSLIGTFIVLPLEKDIQPYAFISPENGSSVAYDSVLTPQASFTNNGSALQNNVTVGFKIIDSTDAVIYEQTSVIDSVASGETVTVNFPASGYLAIAGVYTIRSYSELSGDQIRGNDSLSGTFIVLPLEKDIQPYAFISPENGSSVAYDSVLTPRQALQTTALLYRIM